MGTLHLLVILNPCLLC